MSRVAWKRDEDAPACHVCKSNFSFPMRRKHHCRACGEVVCDPCSPTSIPVTGYTAPEKACKLCVDAYTHYAVYPVDDVNKLCKDFKKDEKKNESNRKALSAAKKVLNDAKAVIPPPFNALVHAASIVVQLAEQSLGNTAECIRLACRVARINFIVLEMATKGATPAVRQCTEDLKEAIRKATDLLKRFQGTKDLGLADCVKATYQMYFNHVADEFFRIHEELTSIVQESTLGLALHDKERCAAPSIEDIRKGVRDEVARVMDKVEWLGQEMGERLDNVQEQLQAILDSPGFGNLPPRRKVFEPRDVVLDKTTVLGRGTFGAVYLGKLYGKTEVAVKVVPADVATVEAEIRRTMLVRHPNVVRIFGIVEPDELEWTAPGVVMERLGVSLEAALEEAVQPMAPSVRMQYTLDIIAGMERVHSTDDGVVHFDLKPANILLTLDRRCAKIIDFGESQTRRTVAMDLSASTRGTVPFMAPEILSGASRPTTACDVYSFAVLLMELWTGTVAWKGTPEAAIVAGIKAGARPLSHVELMAAGVPDPIIELIDACWAQDPHDRPSFEKLAMLGKISNFYEAPQKQWPPFLIQRVKQREDEARTLAQAAALHQTQVEETQRREQEENERVHAERATKRKDAELAEARLRAAEEAEARLRAAVEAEARLRAAAEAEARLRAAAAEAEARLRAVAEAEARLRAAAEAEATEKKPKEGAAKAAGRALTAEQAADQLTCPHPHRDCVAHAPFSSTSNMRRHFNGHYGLVNNGRIDDFKTNYAKMCRGDLGLLS
jgi:hypothetical protein